MDHGGGRWVHALVPEESGRIERRIPIPEPPGPQRTPRRQDSALVRPTTPTPAAPRPAVSAAARSECPPSQVA